MDNSQLHQALDGAGLAQPVVQVLQLFQSELVAVAFPDVSAESLAEEAHAVVERVRELERARSQVQAAEAALSTSKQALLRSVERGLAYARVYAADDEELRQTVDAIARPHPKQLGATTRRKVRASRRRKVSTPGDGVASDQMEAQLVLERAAPSIAV